jgi:hypothetical protein
MIFVLHGGELSIEYRICLAMQEGIFCFRSQIFCQFFDEIFRRIINFIYACTNCGSGLLLFVVRHGLYIACINSPLGRNASLCSLRFDLSLNNICTSTTNFDYFIARSRSRLTVDVIVNARLALEIITVRDGYFSSPCIFTHAELIAVSCDFVSARISST